MWTTSLALGVLTSGDLLALKRHIDNTPRSPALRTWTSLPLARDLLPG